jgi:hypothetical protein
VDYICKLRITMPKASLHPEPLSSLQSTVADAADAAAYEIHPYRPAIAQCIILFRRGVATICPRLHQSRTLASILDERTYVRRDAGAACTRACAHAFVSLMPGAIASSLCESSERSKQ